MQGISWAAEELLFYQEGLCSLELVSCRFTCIYGRMSVSTYLWQNVIWLQKLSFIAAYVSDIKCAYFSI